MAESIKIGLFDPGMTHIHRVGLAGLFMTLTHLQKENRSIGGGTWSLAKDSVELSWSGNVRDFLEALLKESFGLNDGLVDFAAHRGHAMGDLERINLSEAVRLTFLQHYQQNRIPKGTPDRTRLHDFGDTTCSVSYKPFINSYANSNSIDLLTTRTGKLKKECKIKGWLYPGAAERHSSLSGTEIAEPPGRVLCLLFSPVATLYFKLSHRTLDGKYDKRRSTALVFPHLNDLEAYARCFGRFLRTPVERLSANGVGDAGLSALVALKAGESLEDLGLSGCSVVTMGQVGWSKQQKSRTGITIIENLDEASLDRFDHAWRCLPNRRVVIPGTPTVENPNPDNTFFISVSQARGVIADNIAAGRDWFRSFVRLMRSKKLAAILSFERRGLNQMVVETEWSFEADQKLVEAIHIAIRKRYGALAAQAKKRNEAIRFNREYERMRTGLMRVKNGQLLRAELADLFARGGLNKILQDNWREVLPLFSGQDWQRSRDLALLALASYAGKGAEIIESETEAIEEEEE